MEMIKNLKIIFGKFDIQHGEISQGLILSTSIFGYNKVHDYVPFGNFWVFYLTFLGIISIFCASNIHSKHYFRYRAYIQIVIFLTSIFANLIIWGILATDGKNHFGEGENVFWVYPLIMSMYFVYRNISDLNEAIK